MSGNLRLYGATSGYSQISAPDVAGDQIFVVPSLGGEVIVSGNNQSLDLGTGDLTATTVNAGNVVLPDNGGITFGDSYTSGNGASGVSKVLDDYEEGDWTPAFSNFDTWTNPTFNAKYTKIGRVVHFILRQTGGTVGWSTNQNIAGLPYVPREACSCYATDTGPTEDNGVVLIWTNGNIYFNGANGAEGSLVVSGTYITDG